MKDGGPAFPQGREMGSFSFVGMSLRDYFAAKAMQSIVAGWLTGNTKAGRLEWEEAAAGAYGCADAMLKERAK